MQKIVVLSKEISKGLKSAIGEVVRTAEITTMQPKKVLRLEGEVLEGGAFDAGSKKIAAVRREPVGSVLISLHLTTCKFGWF